MSERKINLEEIIKLYSLSDTITTRQSFIYFGKQLLELAAENAKVICNCSEEPINWNALLNTIKQVE